MMNEEMLRSIEYLRERADISYEEAATLLEQNDGSAIRVLMVLEQQGRLYSQEASAPEAQAADSREESQTDESDKDEWRKDAQQATQEVKTFLKKAFQNRLVVKRKDETGKNKTLLNVSVPLAVGAAIVAPHLAVGAAVVAVVTGCSTKLLNDNDKEKGSSEG